MFGDAARGHIMRQCHAIFFYTIKLWHTIRYATVAFRVLDAKRFSEDKNHITFFVIAV